MGMVTNKIEGRMDVVEDQLVHIHGDVVAVKGNLQRLGPLEAKVDAMLERMSFLEMMKKML